MLCRILFDWLKACSLLKLDFLLWRWLFIFRAMRQCFWDHACCHGSSCLPRFGVACACREWIMRLDGRLALEIKTQHEIELSILKIIDLLRIVTLRMVKDPALQLEMNRQESLCILEQDRQCTYNVTFRRVRESLLPWKSCNITYWSVCVCVCVWVCVCVCVCVRGYPRACARATWM
jgi:hypothetical protein